MTQLQPRKRPPLLRFALALWAVVLVTALAALIWHVAGWLLVTAAVGGAAYALGRRAGKAPGGQA
jgi:ABC-type transport system involved in cytochrome bd biosynthesis fused ATPase/permease subunit